MPSVVGNHRHSTVLSFNVWVWSFSGRYCVSTIKSTCFNHYSGRRQIDKVLKISIMSSEDVQ